MEEGKTEDEKERTKVALTAGLYAHRSTYQATSDSWVYFSDDHGVISSTPTRSSNGYRFQVCTNTV